MILRFWGTRGSLPVALRADALRAKLLAALRAASGRHFPDDAAIRRFIDEELDFAVAGTFGGASSCVEIDNGGEEFVVCDLGSGLREFGVDASRRIAAGHKRARFNLFLSHPHWDHIMGFPFFEPAFRPGTELVFHGGHDIEHALRRQQQDPSFPVPLDHMSAGMRFRRLHPGETAHAAGLQVTMRAQHHHGNSFGYRFEHGGSSVVYTTDAEHKLEALAQGDAHTDFLHGADVAIFDTMYSLADAISAKEDWGHSNNIVAVHMCLRAGVKRLVMFHHEPMFDDAAIERIHRETIRYARIVGNGRELEVLCAFDGMEITV